MASDEYDPSQPEITRDDMVETQRQLRHIEVLNNTVRRLQRRIEEMTPPPPPPLSWDTLEVRRPSIIKTLLMSPFCFVCNGSHIQPEHDDPKRRTCDTCCRDVLACDINSHMDSHFKNNVTASNKKKTTGQRGWYSTEDEWSSNAKKEEVETEWKPPVTYLDRERVDREEKEQQEQDQADRDRVPSVEVLETDTHRCSTCGDTLSTSYSDDDEAWVYDGNVVRDADGLTHVYCVQFKQK
jgi:hypothetical protein